VGGYIDAQGLDGRGSAETVLVPRKGGTLGPGRKVGDVYLRVEAQAGGECV